MMKMIIILIIIIIITINRLLYLKYYSFVNIKKRRNVCTVRSQTFIFSRPFAHNKNFIFILRATRFGSILRNQQAFIKNADIEV